MEVGEAAHLFADTIIRHMGLLAVEEQVDIRVLVDQLQITHPKLLAEQEQAEAEELVVMAVHLVATVVAQGEVAEWGCLVKYPMAQVGLGPQGEVAAVVVLVVDLVDLVVPIRRDTVMVKPAPQVLKQYLLQV